MLSTLPIGYRLNMHGSVSGAYRWSAEWKDWPIPDQPAEQDEAQALAVAMKHHAVMSRPWLVACRV